MDSYQFTFTFIEVHILSLAISTQITEGPNWNSVELKVKILTEKLRVEMI